MSLRQPKPQQTMLFRIVAFIAHLQIGYLVRSMKNPRLFVILFAVSAGAVALGIITMAAYLTNFPLVFPPLGASAFILFYTPMSSRASPRNVIVSHTMALFLGLISLFVLTMLYPESKILGAGVICWPRVAAIALAMGLSSAVMISFDCDHPPAAATALIAAMGYVATVEQILAFVAAVVLLVLEAFVLNRMLGGLPYPCWRFDPKVAEDYMELTGLSGGRKTFVGQMMARIFQHR